MYSREALSSGRFNSNSTHTGKVVYVAGHCAEWCILLLTIVNLNMVPLQIYFTPHTHIDQLEKNQFEVI